MIICTFLENDIYIDQPKLISKFRGRPDQTRPDQTTTTTAGLTLFHAISQLKLNRSQPNLKLKLTEIKETHPIPKKIWTQKFFRSKKIDQPKLIPKFRPGPDPTRPDQTRPDLTRPPPPLD